MHIVGSASFGLLLLTQFVNCEGGGGEGNLFSSFETPCFGAECLNQDPETLLSLRVNKPDTVWVSDFSHTINLGGDCNERDFEDNKVIWYLSSSSAGAITDSETLYRLYEDLAPGAIDEDLNAKCVNGRFQIKITLVNSSWVPTNTGETNRLTGLSDGNGSPIPHTVRVEIVGIRFNSAGEPIEVRNPLNSPDYITLQPICAYNASCP